MKSFVFNILFLISGLFCICSCSNGEDTPLEYEEFHTLDLGEGTYRPNPFPFLDNLPPFSWMGMPDSVKLKTTLQIGFNEDAIRSNSTAKLAFLDNNGNIVEGLTYDGHDYPYVEIDASDLGYDQVAIVPIEITVDPSLGNRELNGSIAVFDADVDVVNQQTLTSSPQAVASWSLTQHIGINWLRWLLLIIIIILIIYLICWLIKGLILVLGTLIASTSRIVTVSTVRNNKKFENMDDEQELTPLEILKKYSTKDIVDMVLTLDKTDNNLTIENLRVERRYDGTLNVYYENTYPGRFTSMRIKNNNISAPAGSLGKGSPQNQFLNHVLPHKVYHVDNVAIYKTDGYGRITYAEAERVEMKKIVRGGRNKDTQNQITAGLTGYDGGHLFDCASGGANEAINQVPMESYFNQNGKWKNMESEEKQISTRANSFVVIRTIKYRGSSRIPYEFENTYIINGHRDRTFCLPNPTP